MTHGDGRSRRSGDNPSGLRWSAHRPIDDADNDTPFEVAGTTIRFAPDERVTVPLWDEEGLLPDDPESLHQALGLSPALVRDIAAWGEDWNAPNAGRQFTPEEHRERQVRLDVEAGLLVERLRSELPSHFTVVYQP